MISIESVRRWFFLLFVFSVPFQTRIVLYQWSSPFNEWTSAFLWGSDILFAVLLLTHFSAKGGSASGGKLSYKKDLFLFLFLIISALSITHALIPGVGWYRLAKLIEFTLLFLVVRSALRDTRMRSLTLTVIIFSALFQSVIGISQYVLQHDLGLRMLGESVLDPAGQGVAVVVANARMYVRAYGTTPHPNVLATWLMLGIWALWALRPRWYLYALPLLTFGLLLTFSRTAIAVWLICSVLLALYAKRWDKKIIITTIAVGIVFVVLLWPQVWSRLHLSASDEAVSQRIFYHDVSVQISKTSFFGGIGIGQFVPRLMRDLPMYPDFLYQPSHNMFLLIVNETGIFGLLFFLAFIAVGIRKSPLLLAFVLLAIFDHYFWTLQQGSFMWWGLLGYLARDTIKISV